jgi:hypothetical protein
MHSGRGTRCRIVHRLPPFDEPFQIARIDQDPSHDTAVACPRARDANRGDVSVEHEIAQCPVAAAKTGRCCPKAHQPTARQRSLHRASGGISRQGTTYPASLRFSPRRQLLPDEVAYARLHGRCSTAGLASLRFALDASAGVERHAQRPLIPQDLTRRRTRPRAVVPGRPRPLVITPRGRLRPDNMGRERPPSERVRGRPPGGGTGGRSRPQLALHHHPRGVCGGKERRRILDGCENASSRAPASCGFGVVRAAAPSASPIRRSVQRLEGDNSDPRRCPPFCPPCRSARAAIN